MRLNPDHFHLLLDWYEERGHRFDGLDEVLVDRAYGEEDESVSRVGESFWIRLRRSRAADDEVSRRSD